MAEATVRHQADLSVRPLRAGEVLTAALVAVVPLETSGAAVAAAALEVLTEGLTEEAMVVAAEVVAEDAGKLKEKVSEEGPMWSFFFYPIPD